MCAPEGESLKPRGLLFKVNIFSVDFFHPLSQGWGIMYVFFLADSSFLVQCS